MGDLIGNLLLLGIVLAAAIAPPVAGHLWDIWRNSSPPPRSLLLLLLATLATLHTTVMLIFAVLATFALLDAPRPPWAGATGALAVIALGAGQVLKVLFLRAIRRRNGGAHADDAL